MGRNLDTGTVSAISAPAVRMAAFFYGSFKDGDVYVWSGIGNIIWNSQIWIGLGQIGGESLGSISSITEDTTLSAQGVTVALGGIDSTMLAHALNAVQQGKPAKIWLNLFDDSNNIIGTVLCYSGLIDQPTIEEGGQTCKISLALENRLSDLQRAQQRRWTPQEQRSRYPTDSGFDFVNCMLSFYASWGAS